MWSYFIDHLNPQFAEPMAASVYAVMFLASGAFTAMLVKMVFVMISCEHVLHA